MFADEVWMARRAVELRAEAAAAHLARSARLARRHQRERRIVENRPQAEIVCLRAAAHGRSG